jgi:hypothetical protein
MFVVQVVVFEKIKDFVVLPELLQVLVGMRDTQRDTSEEAQGLNAEIAGLKALISGHFMR